MPTLVRTPEAAATVRRLTTRSVARFAGAVARAPVRTPAATALGTVIVSLMISTTGDNSLHAWLSSHMAVSWPQIERLALWRVPSSALLQDDAGSALAICLMLPVLFVAERRFGTGRMVLGFFGGDAIASVPVLAAVELHGGREARELAADPNLGSSAALLTLLAATIASARDRRLRRLGLAALATGLAVNVAIDHDLGAAQHVIAAGIGLTVMTFRQRSGRSATVAPC